MRRLELGLLVAAFALTVGALPGVSSASASPWWHLTSVTRPGNLQPGTAKDEVQEIEASPEPGETQIVLEVKVKQTTVALLLTEPMAKENALPEANAQYLQEALEQAYGQGNVTVGGGPLGVRPFIVTSVHQDADRSMPPIEITAYVGRGSAHVRTPGQVDGQVVVTAANLGDEGVDGASSPVKITDELPAGLKAVSMEGFSGKGEAASDTTGPVDCNVETLTCSFQGKIPPYDQIEVVIGVTAENTDSGMENQASVSGGGARPVSVRRPVRVADEPTRFGVEDYELDAEDEGGNPDTQAGSHPSQLTSSLALNETGEGYPAALAKDLRFNLPPGLIGNPTPFPQCRLAQFLEPGLVNGEFENNCPAQTAVGVARITINEPGRHLGETVYTFVAPLFNLEPSTGEPARFGFTLPRTPVLLDTSVRTGGDYGVSVEVNNIAQTVGFLKSEVTFWGVPGDPRHDSARGWGCLQQLDGEPKHAACGTSEAAHAPPLLALPTSCTGPLQTSVEADSWELAGAFQTYPSSEPMQALDGCNRLPFSPSIIVAADSTAGSTPSGLDVDVHVPQEVSLNPGGLAEADVKDTTVALPAGVALNPADADGLQACSEAQIALTSDSLSSCPEASKVATLEIKSPLLPNALTGEAYLAAQSANPFGSLVALYLEARDPVSGTLVKLAGEVKPDPVTGQLVATFKDTPQLPFEDLKLHFFGGDRAPLSTPGLCGAYTTTASIAPWSGNEPAASSSTFDVVSGPNGARCSSPLPFSPSLTAGTTSIQAGGFSPFTMTMTRPDGSQNLRAIKLKMPPGLLGTLATVKLCKDEQANTGTCGAESLIGHTIVSVGVGGDPYSVKGGEVFITEGYEGAPYGLSIVNPAKAGPFDLGKVIVRAKIEVDPITAVLTITTDTTGPYKIPTILDGIPLQIQHVNVSIDRPGFTFNPTDCRSLSIMGSLTSDQDSVSDVNVPFQVTNCAVLAFKPKLTANTAGKTSRKNGASLSVKLTYPAGPYDANIARVKVDLPKQLPSRLTTLQKACPAATFEANPAACPTASIVGHARATTPVLPVPLTGPAYFVSHAGEEFPSLIIVLQGYGTTVHLIGSTYISPKTNITSSTFKSIPDVPVGTFELSLPQGPYSALAAIANLCTTKLVMPTAFVAQNGAEIHTSTPIVPTGCAKHARAKAKKTRAKAKKK